MKAAFTTLTLAAGASAAAVLPRDAGCCFGLTASGGVSGSVSQLSDGQNRVGGAPSSTSPARYCLNNGGITDGNGRGCILTPPTTQFQCDMGASPTTGFSVSGSGNVAYNGNTQFVACPVNDNGEYNIYITAPEGQGGCKSITLSTGGACSSSSGASSAPASSAPASSAPASSAPASSKPASSAPASSAPASSAAKPASSAPASSAPSAPASSAPSAPAPSAPAPSAPAPSAPASSAAPQPSVSMVTSCTTYAVTHYAPAPSAPASQSAPAPSAPASSAPDTTAAPSAPTAYACNPAHSYPNGAQCVSSGTGLTLVTPAPSAPASSVHASSSAPAPSAPVQSAPASSAPASSAQASASAPAPSAPATAPAASSPVATKASASASGSACATTLQSGAYQTPHLIVPVNKDSPSTSYGTQYNASINQKNSTIFQFDIPQSYAGKQCSLVFLWPQQSQLETSSFTNSGNGDITFGQCSAQTTESTTYATAGDYKAVGSAKNAAPGNSYVIATGPCAAGQSVSYEAGATGDMDLTFFEDWNPSPIGVFITSC